MTRAILALGSNLGERASIIGAGIRAIADLPGVELVAISGLVETPALKPDGVDLDAPAYLNGVVAVETDRDPHELLADLNAIERELGRVRDVRWGDRTLDIDIITFGDGAIDTPDLTVPHPRAAGRAFVLAPWLQIEPDARLPQGRVADLLAATGESPVEVTA